MSQNNNKKRLVPVYLSALAYALIVGFSFVFIKFSLEFADPMTVLAHRFLFSFVALFILLLAKRDLKFFSPKPFLDILPLAFIYPLLFFGFQTFGLEHATSAEGGILFAVAPVFTLLLSQFLIKEKASTLQIFSVLLSVSGVIYIFYRTAGLEQSSGERSMIGIVLLLLNSLSFALYSVLARRYTDRYDSLHLSTVMITVGFIGFHILLLGKNALFGQETAYLAPLTEPKYLLSIFYLGVLSTLGTSMLNNFALSHLEASKMSVFTNLGTLISIFAGAVILDERVYFFHVIGAIFIIIGVIGTNLGQPSQQKKREEKKKHKAESKQSKK